VLMRSWWPRIKPAWAKRVRSRPARPCHCVLGPPAGCGRAIATTQSMS
jgi:hypothetical protein